MAEYVSSCTEEQFNQAMEMMALNEKSEQWAQDWYELDYGARHINRESPGAADLERILDNAVAMGLMTKHTIAGYAHDIYQAVQQKKLKAA